MKAMVPFDFACNDPDNGIFAGRAAMAHFGECELEAPNWDGFAFTVLNGAIRIHRRRFSITSSKDWIGNWCWNRYWLPRSEAKRLLNTLRDNGWQCVCGPSRFLQWMNREQAA